MLEIVAQQFRQLSKETASDRLLPPLFVTVGFGVAAYLLRGVTRYGAVAGTIVAFLIYAGLGWGGFVTLVAVFAITWLCTSLGSTTKQQLGLAQGKAGRDAAQVLANVSAAAVFATIASRNPLFTVAAVACLAEASADTAQSEIGEFVSSRAWLITTFREVEPGTDGGVTLTGLLAGAIAAFIVAEVAKISHLFDAWHAGLSGAAGLLGTIVDSLLGATLERRRLLNNNGVNFISTVAAGAIAVAISQLLARSN